VTEKKFLVRWANGEATTLTLTHIQERWDMDYTNDEDDEYEETLGEWLDAADVGDEFVHQDDREVFIRTE
jgi:hypothetical protein